MKILLIILILAAVVVVGKIAFDIHTAFKIADDLDKHMTENDWS